MPKPTKTDVGLQRAVVVTALREEYLAIRSRLRGIAKDPNKGTIYETGLLKVGDSAKWQVSVVEIGKGNPRAALETERAIEHFRPYVALFVGVAGGLKDVALGDVVAGSKIYGYEFGKDGVDFLPRPEVGNCSYALEQMARSVSREHKWLRRLPLAARTTVKCYVAPIVAGEKVLADRRSDLYAFVRQHYSDALAVEMEGFGFALAGFANPKTEFLVIRGISDLVDKKEQADLSGWQPVAARNAAAFACEVLSSIPTERFKYRITIENVDEDEIPFILKRLREAAVDPTITIKKARVGSIVLFVEGTRHGYDLLVEKLQTGVLPEILQVGVAAIDAGHRTVFKRPRRSSSRERSRVLEHGLPTTRDVLYLLARLGFRLSRSAFILSRVPGPPIEYQVFFPPRATSKPSRERLSRLADDLGLSTEELVAATEGTVSPAAIWFCMAVKFITDKRRGREQQINLRYVDLLLRMSGRRPQAKDDRSVIKERLHTLRKVGLGSEWRSQLAEDARRVARRFLT